MKKTNAKDTAPAPQPDGANAERTTLIYNGTCPICSREVAHYRAKAGQHGVNMDFADLHSTDLAPYGLTPDDAARRLYLVRDGALHSGYEATLILWSELPGTRPLARFAALPGIRQIGTFIYDYIAAPALYTLHRRREAKKAA